MIYWLSDKAEKAWDSCPFLSGIVCDVNCENLKGHIILELEIDDDFSYQLDLGDCTGLSDSDVNERFCRRFGIFVSAYEDSGEWCGPILEELEKLRDEFLKTLENN